MPIYEYRCENCGERVEVLVRSAAAKPTCPHCGQPLHDRLISAPHVLSNPRPAGQTCCGRDERCEAPPCSTDDVCRRR